MGNRLSSSGVPTYSYNSSNELTSNSSGSYTYDNNGNTLSDASGKTYTWDFTNRLTQVTVPQIGGGSSVVTFKYDPFGRRIQKSGPSSATNYLYSGWNLVEELDSGGNVLARYTHGTNIDEPIAEARSGSVSYDQADGLGSITSLTNPGGGVAASYSYDAFGNASSTGGSINPFRYTGREYDSDTGVYYYRARYYDSSIGRFLSEDPARFRAGTDYYRYARNEPTKYVDPSGLCECNIRIQCHFVDETYGFGSHCWFVAKDSNGSYHRIDAQTNNPVDGTMYTRDSVTPTAPNEPGAWTTNLNSDYNCDKTNCLIGYAKFWGDSHQAQPQPAAAGRSVGRVADDGRNLVAL